MTALRVLPCIRANDSFYLRMDQSFIRLRTLEHGPLPLLPGWTPTVALTGPRGVSVLRLQHAEQGWSEWFLNENFRFVTNSFAGLPTEAQAELLTAIPEFPDIRWEELSRDLSADPGTDPMRVLPSVVLSGVRIFNDKTIAEAAAFGKFWRENEYLVIPDALTDDAVALLAERIIFESAPAEDPRQFQRVHSNLDSTQFINQFHAMALEYYEAVLSSRLLPTYAFAMKYVKDADLLPHYDNIRSPISSTICYRFSPDDARNPLYFDRAKFLNPYQSRLTVSDKLGIPAENIVRVDLAPGDLAVFRGRTHLHWREAVSGQIDYRALLCHFTDSEYKNIVRDPTPVTGISEDFVDLDNYQEFREKYAIFFERNGQSWV